MIRSAMASRSLRLTRAASTAMDVLKSATWACCIRDYTDVMTSRIEKIETEIMQLSVEELDAFRAWFTEYDFDAWDRQISADSNAGKLDHLAAEAMRDYEAGLTTEL